MTARWSNSDLAAYAERRGVKIEFVDPPKANKYSAIKTEVDGIVFDSKRESTRYQDLRIMQQHGLISDLELQPVYDVVVNGRYIGKYRADFRYKDETGNEITEDTKGVRTQLYLWKKRLVEAIYNIKIIET